MIIKSLSRKASGGAGGGKSPFKTLIRYMTRGIEEEEGRAVLWHNFFGHEGVPEKEILDTFEANAAHLRARKNGNVLYHEILSFSEGHTLSGEKLYRAVTDIGQEYLRQRAPNQLGYGVIHLDTGHIHLHLLISANEIGRPQRTWLTKKDFADIQKQVERYTLDHYKDLGQSLVYDRGDRDKTQNRQKLKTQVHEQSMKARTGEPSRKEALKAQIHGLFARAQSVEELQSLAKAMGVQFYTRGKSIGVVVRDPDGHDRRHRLSTLGLMEHYQATQERLNAPGKTQSQQKPPQQDPTEKPAPSGNTQEQDMNQNKTPFDGWGESHPSDIEIVEYEFLTGKLHPDWHGKPEPDPTAEVRKAYSDKILDELREREAAEKAANQAQKQQATPNPPQPTHPPKSPPTRDKDDDWDR